MPVTVGVQGPRPGTAGLLQGPRGHPMTWGPLSTRYRMSLPSLLALPAGILAPSSGLGRGRGHSRDPHRPLSCLRDPLSTAKPRCLRTSGRLSLRRWPGPPGTPSLRFQPHTPGGPVTEGRPLARLPPRRLSFPQGDGAPGSATYLQPVLQPRRQRRGAFGLREPGWAPGNRRAPRQVGSPWRSHARRRLRGLPGGTGGPALAPIPDTG